MPGPTGPTAPTEFDNFVFRPGGVQQDNVYTSWTDLIAAMTPVQGWKTIQFDDSIVSPCVIPAGTYDMTDVEWTAFLKGTTPAAVAVSLGGVPSGGDVVLPNLRSFGGSLNPLTNRNVGGSPIVIPVTGQYIVEIGEGTTGDFPQFNNAGPTAWFDASALLAGQAFLIRMQGSISGAAPAIQMGASPAAFQVSLYDSARIHAGMIAGTNPAAQIQIFNFGTSGQVNRQAGFAGSITYGRPASFTGLVGWPRSWMFPASVNQAPTVPSAVAFTPATGLGMNTCLRFNTTAGAIAQTLPLIRAAAPPNGAFSLTPGALESTGLVVIVKNEIGGNPVNVSPDPTNPDTIDGGAGPVVVPPGGSRTFMSDGVGNWSIIGGYL